jgi:hypothetical protein
MLAGNDSRENPSLDRKDYGAVSAPVAPRTGTVSTLYSPVQSLNSLELH